MNFFTDIQVLDTSFMLEREDFGRIPDQFRDGNYEKLYSKTFNYRLLSDYSETFFKLQDSRKIEHQEDFRKNFLVEEAMDV